MSALYEKKLLLAVNPVSGKGQGKSKLFEAVDCFTKSGYRVTVLPTAPNRLTEDIIASEAGDYDLITAIGGDGTLNMAVNGILRSRADVPLGYIPLGSTNDFAASLGLKKKISEASKRIAEGEAKYIDIGQFGDRYFVYIACTGLFAGASYMTSQQLKNIMGHSAYLLRGISDLAEAKKVRYTVELDNEIIGGDFLLASFSNTLRAGGMFTWPKSEVSFDDGLFEVTLVKAPKNIKEATLMTNDMLNFKLSSEAVIRKKFKNAKVTFDSPRGWSLDGENGGEFQEAVIRVKHKALRLIY